MAKENKSEKSKKKEKQQKSKKGEKKQLEEAEFDGESEAEQPENDSKFHNPLGPIKLYCKTCGTCVRVNVNFHPKPYTHAFAIIMAITCCWFLSCLPYLMDMFENAECYCSQCGSFLGNYKNECH